MNLQTLSVPPCTFLISVCSGVTRNAPVDKTDTVSNRLKFLYENCSIIDGNLEITDLHESEADRIALQSLALIEEVYGYVLIANNQISNVALPNLHTIWGDDLHTIHFQNNSNGGFSFVIKDNTLKILDLRKLITVNRGNIGLFNNPSMCHWKSLNYDQLFGTNKDNQLLEMDSNFALCTVQMSNCSTENCQHCFEPRPDQCQQIFNKSCELQCKNLCSNDSTFCCHPQCSRGCYGPNATQCYTCKNMIFDGKCVEKCPPRETYNWISMEYQTNPHGAYSFHRTCVKKCPSYTLQYRDSCVYNCPKYYKSEEGRCNLCDNKCPNKTCIVREIMNIQDISVLENCTVIDGFIAITSKTFTNSFGLNLNQTLLQSLLNFLSKIEYVTDFVLIESESEYLTSLKFLQNLRIIEGRRLYKNQYSLVIRNNPGLEYFGWKKFDSIINGIIMIKGNARLCYIQNIPWNEKVAKFDKTEIDRIPCKKECHKACQTNKGCWGDSADLCYECKSWKLSDICVENCTLEYGYFATSDKICQQCHPECLTCTGPTEFDCVSCKFAVYEGRCLSACPNNHYLDRLTGMCTKCHKNCFDFGCSGGGNYIGAGGCNRCRYGIYDSDKDSVPTCFYEWFSQEQCAQYLNISDYFSALSFGRKFSSLIERGVCLKCLDVCQTCHGYGNHEQRDGCVCKSHRVVFGESSYCAFHCPQNYYTVTSFNTSDITECYQCHQQCDGCTGPSLSDCLNCKFFKHYIDDNTEEFVCVDLCPNDRRFVSSDKICTNIDSSANVIMRTESNITPAVAGLISVVIIVSAVGVFCFVFAARRRRRGDERRTAKLSQTDEYFEMNANAKPDLSRLRLIVESELKRGNILGYGAFGTVYQGVWQPKEEDGANVRKIPVAIKVLHESRQISAQQELLEEAGHMARVSHRHLVNLVGVCLCQDMMLVTPLMPLGNLLSYVQNQTSKIDAQALLCWSAQIASGMAYLEKLRLVHRDLAARNVLLQKPNHIRITDFGLAKMLEYGEEELRVEKGLLPLKWLALECIKSRCFTHKSDVWAYGITLWELLTFGSEPYKGVPLQEIPKFLENGQRLPKPNICSDEFYDILLKCWFPDAYERPTFQELHAIFLQMSSDKINLLNQVETLIGEFCVKNENAENNFENVSYRVFHSPEKSNVNYAKVENRKNYFNPLKIVNIFKHQSPSAKISSDQYGKELETFLPCHTYYNEDRNNH